MRAVAWVIHNRAQKWNLTTRGVVMQPNQFTSMCQPPFRHPALSDPQYAEAKEIIANIIDGTDKDDPTNGALYYANLKIATSGWYFEHIVDDPVNHPETAEIGRHSFYS
jgi:spore germination cell wall hydrolase CwlJ-like protein